MYHPGKYDKNTKGICGVKDYWLWLLGDVPIDSLQAGYIVFSYMRDKHNGDLFLSLSEYKGAVYNYDYVLYTIYLYDKLKELKL